MLWSSQASTGSEDSERQGGGRNRAFQGRGGWADSRTCVWEGRFGLAIMLDPSFQQVVELGST